MGDSRFTLAAIRARVHANDDYRREHGLPYADSDIRHLAADVERLRGLVGEMAVGLNDVIRIVKAFRYTTTLGKGQSQRLAYAETQLFRAREEQSR